MLRTLSLNYFMSCSSITEEVSCCLTRSKKLSVVIGLAGLPWLKHRLDEFFMLLTMRRPVLTRGLVAKTNQLGEELYRFR